MSNIEDMSVWEFNWVSPPSYRRFSRMVKIRRLFAKK
jgi:hypothetical protein